MWEERNYSIYVFQSNVTIEPFFLEHYPPGTDIQGNVSFSYKPSLIFAHSFFYYEHFIFWCFSVAFEAGVLGKPSELVVWTLRETSFQEKCVASRERCILGRKNEAGKPDPVAKPDSSEGRRKLEHGETLSWLCLLCCIEHMP